MARFGNFDQYLDNAGDPLAEGKLYFYESGTTTPKTTYSDVNNSIPNTNPVLLSAAGRQPNIFFEGVAKVILTDNNDVQIAVRDPVGETGTDFGDEWVASKIYSANDVVLGSDGIYYRSLSNGNQNNNPVTSTGFWTLLYSVEWNSGITYSVGDVVTYGSQQYQSLQNSNLNQNPSTQAAYWVGLSFAWLATTTYETGMNAVGTDGVLYTSLQDSNTGNDPATSPAYWVGTSAAAAASATAAAASAAAALVSENAAATSETNAAASESAAATSATNSANSATASAASATASAASAAAAATSETNAATSASDSATSASQSATSATASAASATAALASETAAAASETAAAASESAAATSATNAATSATASATSATNSANSATASASSATDSANSATASAGSATAAAGSATSAAGSATAAASSATDAATAETGAEDALAEFETQYLGSSATAPTGTILTGALYFNTTSNTMFVYTGSSWAAAGSAVNGTAERQEYVATSGQTNFSATYDVGFVDVYLNGVKLIPTTDFTATDGATIILATGAVAGDNVSIIAYGAFNVADVYTQAQSDARYTQQSNNLSDLDSAATALTNLGLTATAAELNYTDGVTSNIQAQIDNIDALPSQTGESGKFLTTDGTNASWDAVDVSSEITGTLPVANGGTGATTLTANNVLLGNGTSAPLAVAPSTSGNVLTSNGTTWESIAPAGGGFSALSVITTTSSFTVPAGKSLLKITAVGGGASGATNGASNRNGAGGGGGGAAIVYVSVSEGDTVSITVGAGGAAPTAGTYTNGISGGTTTVTYAGANIAVATGGGGGSSSNGAGGDGGIGTTGDVLLCGSGGGATQYDPSGYLMTGFGGASGIGTGGAASAGTSNPTHIDGRNYGGGGMGCNGTNAAGSGGDGVVMIEY